MTYPVAKATVKVVDELGNPIEGAQASIGFHVSKGFMEQGIRDVSEKGITGADGVFSASHRSSLDIAFGADKQGYYKSYGQYHFNNSAIGRWQPWNPEFKLVLRKIENPVPMFARNTKMTLITLPVTNKSIGLDLIEFDWVPPYGKGKHADFIFKYTGTHLKEDDFNKKLEVTFPNKFDGIQLVKEDRRLGSILKLPRRAPETGYTGKLLRSRSMTPGKPRQEDSKEDNNYIFRVRSEENNGKLVRAMYGKIHGDIYFDTDASNKATIIFIYYLNPDYTNNLEFDHNKNLFKELKSFETGGL
jgi:hypothetical protein